MSNSRAAEYRSLIEDVVAGGLLEENEIAEIRDLLARVERKMLANMPPAPTSEAAE